MQDSVISRRIAGIQFGYYSSKEIRKISVKEITNPLAFDQLNRPIAGGLYDPLMGVSPYDKFSRCITCGQEGLDCPGHIGHIELLMPVYNPFIIDRLLKLLRAKCFYCHRLRITPKKLQNYKVIFTLIKLGFIQEAKRYKDICENQNCRILQSHKDSIAYSTTTNSADQQFNNFKQGSRKDSEASRSAVFSINSRKQSDTAETNAASHISVSMRNSKKGSIDQNQQQQQQTGTDEDGVLDELKSQILENIKDQQKQLKALTKPKNFPDKFLKGILHTNTMNHLFEDILKEFWSSVQQKCPHCKKSAMQIRKEGYSKFFIMQNQTEENKTSSVISTSREGLPESDNEDDSSSQEVAQKSKKGNTQFQDLDPTKQKHKTLDEQEDELEDSKKKKREKKQQKYINPIEVKNHIQLLWKLEHNILNLIFGTIEVTKKTLQQTSTGYRIKSNGCDMFFIEVVPVQPNRFRPENKLGDQTYLHGHTVILTKILQQNVELRNMIVLQKIDETQETSNNKKAIQSLQKKLEDTNNLEIKENELVKGKMGKVAQLTDIISKWLEIQDSVNCFMDSSKSSKASDREQTGIRQLLEKKEGLFRMKMMGKRVNFAARSVISPDPNLNTNEVGVPIFMAKKLTFPENVNEYNVQKLREYVIRGPFEHPGANFVEEANGRRIALEALNEVQRTALAKTLLLNGTNKVVFRHLQTGDVVLFNRQPTLHKPSLMSHIAKVLPREQTIRMHYSNCKSYNADFDGDEMNMHFLQSHLARSEAKGISLNDNQYISTTSGKPLRELIQDHIISSVFLTLKDTLLDKEQYMELLYLAISNLNSGSSRGGPQRIQILLPAILKPKRLWTGKQLISNILKVLVQTLGDKQFQQEGLNMECKAKLSGEELQGIYKEDVNVIVRDNELLQGVLDKNQLGGGAEYGLVHAWHEVYGAELTGKLLSSLGRVLMHYLQMHGFTCGMDDLILKPGYEEQRRNQIKVAHQDTLTRITNEFLGLQIDNIQQSWDLVNRPTYKSEQKKKKKKDNVDYIGKDNILIKAMEKKLIVESQTALVKSDGLYKESVSSGGSKVISISLQGLIKDFPENNFSTMTRSGAKGSKVNHSQVSALLGQQELEGQRVPMMCTGRTLPCFLPYDPNPRSGGFISDRFLSGLRPAEFFFHCMAGREGLVDTAVKTSRSGYLQRCLMKHLESLHIAYDYTVRDADESIVQFYFGEDSIDPSKMKYLQKFGFLTDNFKSFSQKFDPIHLKDYLDFKTADHFANTRDKNKEFQQQDTIMNNFWPGKFVGSVSEKYYNGIKEYLKDEKKKTFNNIFNETITTGKFRILANIKYIHSLIQPGEAVGCVAAQSIGEPSTQMTLNTFHLAGHGGVNLTLGIPRLREILMTASDKIKTPVMIINFTENAPAPTTQAEAAIFARKLQRLTVLELVKKITVKEYKRLIDKDHMLPHNQRHIIYEIDVEFEELAAIEFAFGMNISTLKKKMENQFMSSLLSYVNREQKNKDNQYAIMSRVSKNNNVDNEEEGGAKTVDDIPDDIFDAHDYNDEMLTENIIRKDSDNSEELIINQNQNINQQDKIHQEQEDQQQQQLLSMKSPFFESFQFDNQNCKISIKLPLDSKKLLMVNIVHKLLQNTLIYEIKGIYNAYVLKTEGVNYKAVWNMDFVNTELIDSNDIQAIWRHYGIEAARNAIVKEILAVFSVYGVNVDYRHLYLIADYMTQSGKIKAMNRQWIEESISPFLKMSFETCVKFLTNASLNCEEDMRYTPSSDIILGRVPNVGTGAFNILQKL